MICIQRQNLLDYCVLVIDKYFNIKISEEIKIYFIPIVSDRHDERALFVQHINFLLQRQLLIVFPHDHKMNIQ